MSQANASKSLGELFADSTLGLVIGAVLSARRRLQRLSPHMRMC